MTEQPFAATFLTPNGGGNGFRNLTQIHTRRAMGMPLAGEA